MIITEKLSKSFGHIDALKDINLQVGKGELFGMIGPDGAGKTTLFRILVTLLQPDEGMAFINGNNVIHSYRKIREIIGYMPGRFSLYHDLSVRENLHFYATVFGTTLQENYDLIRDIYQQIEPFRDRLAGNLSGGMKQKLALSCALIHRPEILVLDEPTTGVDAVSRKEFWEMLRKIREQGITILVSTPYMDEAALCDRIGLLQKGRLLSVHSPDKIGEEMRYPMFVLKSDLSLYGYLEKIRALQACRSAYLFGNEIHLTLQSESDIPGIQKEFRGWDDRHLEWEPLKPGIEDYFMELMKENH